MRDGDPERRKAFLSDPEAPAVILSFRRADVDRVAFAITKEMDEILREALAVVAVDVFGPAGIVEIAVGRDFVDPARMRILRHDEREAHIRRGDQRSQRDEGNNEFFLRDELIHRQRGIERGRDACEHGERHEHQQRREQRARREGEEDVPDQLPAFHSALRYFKRASAARQVFFRHPRRVAARSKQTRKARRLFKTGSGASAKNS